MDALLRSIAPRASFLGLFYALVTRVSRDGRKAAIDPEGSLSSFLFIFCSFSIFRYDTDPLEPPEEKKKKKTLSNLESLERLATAAAAEKSLCQLAEGFLEIMKRVA